MMNNNTQNTQTVNVGLNSLKASINILINKYKRVHALLEKQIQIVINNDIPSLNKLIAEQVAAYETLKKAEGTFKKQIQSFHYVLGEEQHVSLRNILASLDKPTETLDSLRKRLHAQVSKTERLQSQVMDLIQFARQQNTEIFKMICALASNAADGYDARGKKMQNRSNGLAINQKA